MKGTLWLLDNGQSYTPPEHVAHALALVSSLVLAREKTFAVAQVCQFRRMADVRQNLQAQNLVTAALFAAENAVEPMLREALQRDGTPEWFDSVIRYAHGRGEDVAARDRQQLHALYHDGELIPIASRNGQ